MAMADGDYAVAFVGGRPAGRWSRGSFPPLKHGIDGHDGSSLRDSSGGIPDAPRRGFPRRLRLPPDRRGNPGGHRPRFGGVTGFYRGRGFEFSRRRPAAGSRATSDFERHQLLSLLPAFSGLSLSCLGPGGPRFVREPDELGPVLPDPNARL